MNQKLSEGKKALIKPYQVVNAEGEVISAIRYVEGQPLNVRFNGLTGKFATNKEDLGWSLTITPVAYRFFTGSIFWREPAKYAEVFYVDANRNLAVVMFTGGSVDNLKRFAAGLHYSVATGQTLTNTLVHVSGKLKIRQSGERYHVAEFEDYGPANPKAVEAFRAFGLDHRIYRADTRSQPGTSTNVTDGLHSTLYFTMWGLGVLESAPADDRERFQIQQQYK